MGSLSLTSRYTFAPSPAYKITKAALNMLTAQYALDFAKEGVTFLAISPGVSPLHPPCLEAKEHD